MALLDKFKKTNKKEPRPETKKDKPEIKESSPVQTVKKDTAWVYKIIKRPHISEKASFLAEKNKYVFKVFSEANKSEIKKAIERLYKVKVKKVHLVHLPAKKRRVGRHLGWRQGLKQGYKKAIVSLAPGHKIEIQ